MTGAHGLSDDKIALRNFIRGLTDQHMVLAVVLKDPKRSRKRIISWIHTTVYGAR